MEIKYIRKSGDAAYDESIVLSDFTEVYLLDVTKRCCNYLIITEYDRSVVEKIKYTPDLHYYVLGNLLHIILFNVTHLEDEDELVNYDLPEIGEDVYIEECVLNESNRIDYDTLAIYRIDEFFGTSFCVTEVRLRNRVSRCPMYSIGQRYIGFDELFSTQMFYDDRSSGCILSRETEKPDFDEAVKLALSHLKL